MSSRYQVLVSQELLDCDPVWERAGLDLVSQGPLQPPGVRWCSFTDPDPDAGPVDGQLVDLSFAVRGGQVVIAGRKVITDPDPLPPGGPAGAGPGGSPVAAGSARRNQGTTSAAR